MRPGSDQLAEALPEADLLIVGQFRRFGMRAAGWRPARLAECDAAAVVLITPPERDRLDHLRAAGYAAYLIRPVRG